MKKPKYTQIKTKTNHERQCGAEKKKSKNSKNSHGKEAKIRDLAENKKYNKNRKMNLQSSKENIFI